MDKRIKLKDWWLQGIRFGIVGLTSNVVLYLFYLLVTTFGTGHKTAMSLLFAVGILQTFVFNKHWTFGHHGFLNSTFTKYVSIYSLAYVLNFCGLMVFVDHMGFPHQIVQGVMIVCIALILFFLQRYWVFRTPEPA